MTKANARKKMVKLGTVTEDCSSLTVSLDNFNLICSTGHTEDSDVECFIIERKSDGFQWFKPNFKQAIERLDSWGW